ncbi:MAG: hypothetical protein IJF55_01905, partial [Clostridia bacterium]|nr:hypothetical protein [Clostridia bacterium]
LYNIFLKKSIKPQKFSVKSFQKGNKYAGYRHEAIIFTLYSNPINRCHFLFAKDDTQKAFSWGEGGIRLG